MDAKRQDTDLGRHIRILSEKAWGPSGRVHLIGKDERLVTALEKLARFARVERTVLLTGESGVGKELFARALYLLSPRNGKPFLSVNCAQYQNEELLVSELFGHRKGSFTGAASDHRGLFEGADGGIVFLDEVGELSPRAQAMLLRVLSEGEIKPLGENRVRRVDVRVVAATNRPLKKMIAENTFREDLYFRLRYLHIRIPPLRDRGDDWRLIVDHYLLEMNRRYRTQKRFSEAALNVLGAYHWPGNIREVKSIIDIGYCLAEEDRIEPEHFEDYLDMPVQSVTERAEPEGIMRRYVRMQKEGGDFWSVVREPFLNRELNRAQVKAIIARGLADAEGSYKKMLRIFRVQQDDYLKFMDFLRHHRLKPEKPHAAKVAFRSDGSGDSDREGARRELA
jgi:transcriptional regulator with GAF, ATPase, and Fis domain